MSRAKLVEPIAISKGHVSLVAFQPQWIAKAWEWLNEDRHANFDDYGPRNLQQFATEMLMRVRAGQTIFAIMRDGEPVGLIGFDKITDRLGKFTGICIAKHAQRQDVGTSSLGLLLLTLWQEGFEKIEAAFFADNEAIAGLFRKLGGHDEGMLYQHTIRNGERIDVKLMGFCREAV